MTWPNVFCWSKVGPEAGLTLSQIVRWKEFQRALTNGIFYWGVGGIPGREKQSAFFASTQAPRVLFSEQLSEARDDYQNPSSTVLWTHYVDGNGSEAPLPPCAAVTSKAGASRHFAIVGRLDAPIRIADVPFDIGLFRNFLGRPNIAYQQPAPIIEVNPSGQPKKLYRRGFWADLAKPCFVSLTRGTELTSAENNEIRALMSSDRTAIDEFKSLIDRLNCAR
jgi:hypothetical protein